MRNWSEAEAAPLIVTVLACLLTFGYATFSYSLNVDDPRVVYYGWSDLPQGWLAAGRWASALIALIWPQPWSPAVPLGANVILWTAACWYVCAQLGMDGWWRCAATSLASTAPVLAFAFSFDSLSPGFGIGAVLLAIYVAALRREGVRGFALAVGTVSILSGVYDSLPVAAWLLGLVWAVLFPRPRALPAVLCAPLLGVTLSWIIGRLAGLALGVERSHYVSSKLELGWVFTDHTRSVETTILDLPKVLLVTNVSTGTDAPWVWATFLVLVGLTLVWLWQVRADRTEAVVRILGLAGLALTPILINTMLVSPPRRSAIFMVVIWIGLVGVASRADLSRLGPRWLVRGLPVALAIVIAMAILSQAMVVNRLFAAAEVSLDADQYLARRIDDEIQRLRPDAVATPVLMERHDGPSAAGHLTPPIETMGLSLFRAGGKDAVAFLKSQGVPAELPTDAQAEAALATLRSMPNYPAEGWAKFSRGVLLIKLSDWQPGDLTEAAYWRD